MAMVEEVLAHDSELSGTESSHLLRLTCYRVLERAGDPRAADVLAVAHANVLAQAVLTSDPALRRLLPPQHLRAPGDRGRVDRARGRGRRIARDAALAL